MDHEGVGHGVECLGGRPHQPAGPFHYLINEQAKSLVALQELQHEVGALLEFRDLVMETFPNLRSKLHQQVASTPATMTGTSLQFKNTLKSGIFMSLIMLLLYCCTRYLSLYLLCCLECKMLELYLKQYWLQNVLFQGIIERP